MRGDVGAEGRAAEIVERRAERARRGRRDQHGSSAASDALAVGLAERDQPHAGRDQVGGDRMQESAAAPASSAMPWPAHATPTATG